MIPSAMAFLESLPFSFSFRAMASWMPVSMISSVSDSRAQLAQIGRRVGLDVGVEEVAHVRLVGLDVQLLARVLLDGGADVAVELDLLLQRGGLGVGVAGLGEILRDRGVGAHESRRRPCRTRPAAARSRSARSDWRRRRRSNAGTAPPRAAAAPARTGSAAPRGPRRASSCPPSSQSLRWTLLSPPLPWSMSSSSEL